MAAWSIVVPQAGINLAENPSAEENAGTYTSFGVGTALAQSDTQSRWGRYSVRVTPGANAFSGLLDSAAGCTPGTVYVCSVWVLGAVGLPYRIYFGDAAGGLQPSCTPTTFTGDGTWHRYQVAYRALAAMLYFCVSKNNSAALDVFYVDGWQLEVGLAATTYMDGDQPGCEWLGVPHLAATARSEHAGGGGALVDLETTYGIHVTTSVGLGLPPLKHKRLDTPSAAGALLDDVHVEPRILTLAAWVNAPNDDADDSVLALARDNLINALKLDRVATLQPVTLYFTSASRTFELHAFYEAGLERNLTEFRFEKFALRLLCYDAFLYEIGEEATPLDALDTTTFSYVGARLRAAYGQWDPLGPTTVGDAVYCVCVASDGTIFVGGAFTGWDGNAGWDYLVKYENGAWARVGGAGDFNAAVYALTMSPNPRILYIGGLFTNAGGATGDYVAQYNLDGNVVSPLSGGGTGVVYALALAPTGDLYIGGDFTNWNALGAGDNIIVYDLSAAAYAVVGTGLDSIVRALAIAPFTGALYAGGAFSNDGTPLAMRCIAIWDGLAWAEVGGGLDNAGGTGLVRALALDAAGNLYAGGAFDRTADGLLTGLNNIAVWDGNSWLPLGTGTDNTVYGLAVGPDDLLHAAGFFDYVGGVVGARGYARWNGYSWMLPDIVWPAGIIYAVATARPDPIIKANYDVIVGYAATAVTPQAGLTAVSNAGSARAHPRFIFRSTGGTSSTLIALRNETTGRELAFAGLYLLDGETIYLDCRPGRRRLYSDRRANLLGYLLRPSDLTRFGLEPGINDLTLLIYQAGGPTVQAHMIWTNTYWSVDPA